MTNITRSNFQAHPLGSAHILKQLPSFNSAARLNLQPLAEEKKNEILLV